MNLRLILDEIKQFNDLEDTGEMEEQDTLCREDLDFLFGDYVRKYGRLSQVSER